MLLVMAVCATRQVARIVLVWEVPAPRTIVLIVHVQEVVAVSRIVIPAIVQVAIVRKPGALIACVAILPTQTIPRVHCCRATKTMV